MSSRPVACASVTVFPMYERYDLASGDNTKPFFPHPVPDTAMSRSFVQPRRHGKLFPPDMFPSPASAAQECSSAPASSVKTASYGTASTCALAGNDIAQPRLHADAKPGFRAVHADFGFKRRVIGRFGVAQLVLFRRGRDSRERAGNDRIARRVGLISTVMPVFTSPRS